MAVRQNTLKYTPIAALPLKESEPVPISLDVDDSQKEKPTPHEAEDLEISSYVKQRPEAIIVDKELEKLGVKPQPQNLALESAIALPLTDAKITEGMHKPITSSWRWLAEFCTRLLQHLHIALKIVHGKIVRVKRN